MINFQFKINRYRLTKISFSVFLVICIFNWALNPNLITFAEDVAPSTTESVDSVVVETAPAQISPDPIETSSAEITEDSVEEIVVEALNQAEIVNVIETVAESGDNTSVALDQDGDASVETGEAVATADVVNIVNTNIVESEGTIIVESGFLGSGSINLGEETIGAETSFCDACQSSTTVSTQNVAVVENEVLVVADSGGNIASSTGESSIVTGESYAGANVVNLVNTNIVESKYLLLVFNNFGDWSGNLVLPSGNFYENFLQNFAGDCPTCEANQKIGNQNEAVVENSVTTISNSGGNEAVGSEGASVSSGQSVANTNVYNQVNTNIYEETSFYLLVKVFGDWSGNIFNLPENMAWERTKDGVILYNTDFDPPSQTASGESPTAVTTANNALVTNNVETSANTGANNASGEQSKISTGDAYAGSNIVNIVNTNIVSSNWTAAMVNVFGDWYGNISFGEPDLWIGTVAESTGTLGPGSVVKFTTTIKNNGNAGASGIKLSIKPNLPWLSFEDEEWFVSPLQPEESTSISYYGSVGPNIPDGHTNIESGTVVSLLEDDANQEDNHDTLSLLVYKEPTVVLPYTSRSASYPNIQVTKKHLIRSSVIIDEREMVPFGGEVDYEIVVKNGGGEAAGGILFDQLKDERGKIISTQSWHLGNILAGEEIVVNYTSKFNEKSQPGLYINYAWVEALGGDYEAFDGALAERADSNIASDTVILATKPVAPDIQIEPLPISPAPAPEVLGIFTENVSLLSEPEIEIESVLLGDFCFEDNQETENDKLTVSESILLGLSFVLIIRKKEQIPFNVFML